MISSNANIRATVEQICVHAKLVESYHQMGVPQMKKYLDLLITEVKELEGMVLK